LVDGTYVDTIDLKYFIPTFYTFRITFLYIFKLSCNIFVLVNIDMLYLSKV